MPVPTTHRIALSALALVTAAALPGCVADAADEPIDEAAQAQIDPFRDYTVYTVSQNGIDLGSVVVTATSGDGFQANREYWYLNQNVSPSSSLVFTSGAAHLWSTPPSGLGTLSFVTSDRPAWTSGTPSGTMLIESKPLTGEQIAIDWHMTVTGGTWSGYITWWHSNTNYIFGPNQTNTLSPATPTTGTWYSFTTSPL